METPDTPEIITSAPFVHLHLHTQYSLLDGAIRFDDLSFLRPEFRDDLFRIM